jgi:Leucine-rich repeat (LRR) protein
MFVTIRMNRLISLPRGFGAFPALEVLDLTYNLLSEKSLPGNFFMLGIIESNSKFYPYFIDYIHFVFIETLRALYLADNEFEYLSPEIGSLKTLQIVSHDLMN